MRQRARARRDDSGVIAVIAALVVVAVLLPITAIGLTSYTRSAVVDEQQRAADAGALNGAANLTLTNLGALTALEQQSLLGGTLQIPSVPNALAAACAEERRTDAVGKPISDAYASGSTCEARFIQPTVLNECLTNATRIVDLALGPVTQSAQTFVNGLGGLLSGLLGTLNTALAPLNLGSSLPLVTTNLTNGLKLLLPALLQNRVAVDVDYAVAGPLDALLPGKGEPTEQQVTATAKRVFKPLLPPLNGLAVGPLAGVPGLGTLLTTAQPVERLAVTLLQTVIAALDVAVGNVASNAAVQTLLTSAGSQLNAFTTPLLGSLTSVTNLLKLLDPLGLLGLSNLLNGLIGNLGANLTAPTAFALTNLNPIAGSCLNGVREVLQDLKDALQVNEDPNLPLSSAARNRGLLPCVLIQVFNVPQTALTAGGQIVDCTNPIFRARLVK